MDGKDYYGKKEELSLIHICREYAQEENIRQIRIAFDGDAVLFTDESERIFQEQGLAAFEENERLKADRDVYKRQLIHSRRQHLRPPGSLWGERHRP